MAFFHVLKRKKKIVKTNLRKQNVEKNTVYSPLKGKMIPLEKVSDQAFAQKVLGDGVAIVPEEGKLYSPVEGKVETLFSTNHAIGLCSDEGMEVLVHIGIDTVQMGGHGFRAHVKQGDTVTLGQLLLEFDIGQIEEAGFETTTMVLILNYQDYGNMTVENCEELDLMDKIISF